MYIDDGGGTYPTGGKYDREGFTGGRGRAVGAGVTGGKYDRLIGGGAVLGGK